jgi:hypothetical protein
VALRRGEVRVAAAREGAVALVREAEGRRALVAVNAGSEPVTLDLDAGAVGGLRSLDLPGINAGSVAASGAAVQLPARSALILVDY